MGSQESGTCRARDPGEATIGADDDRRALLVQPAASVPCPDSRHPPALEQQVDHRRLFPHLGAGLAGSLDQQGVKHGAPRTEHRRDPVDRLGPARHGDRSPEHADPLDRRTARCRETVEQTPGVEERGGARPQEMGRDRIAGKLRAVDHEDAAAPARQQKRQRRSRAARSHDDGIIAWHPASGALDRTTVLISTIVLSNVKSQCPQAPPPHPLPVAAVAVPTVCGPTTAS